MTRPAHDGGHARARVPALFSAVATSGSDRARLVLLRLLREELSPRYGRAFGSDGGDQPRPADAARVGRTLTVRGLCKSLRVTLQGWYLRGPLSRAYRRGGYEHGEGHAENPAHLVSGVYRGRPRGCDACAAGGPAVPGRSGWLTSLRDGSARTRAASARWANT